jgi:hypothetical protein
MKEFALIFRNDSVGEIHFSPEGTLAVSREWENWMGGIAAQNKLASKGNRLGQQGNTVRPNNVITNGPYAEIKEIIGGFIVVKAGSIEEATELAKGCPILDHGGNVEVRDVVLMSS